MSSAPDLLHLIIAAACLCTEATGSEHAQCAGEKTVTIPTQQPKHHRLYITKCQTKHKSFPVKDLVSVDPANDSTLLFP